MANFYGKDREKDFAASKLMSFGKSFSRMNGQPLDESEVWYDKAALEAYAAGNSAYVGMRLVYVDEENQKVYQYSVQYDGSIKEIGTSPIGDNKSIVVDAETGTVSLKGINDLIFSREVDILDEEGNPTGEKTTEEIKYQPLMTDNGLIWVEPSKTTVEGLATEISSIKTDMATQATKIDTLQEVVYGTLAEDGETRNEDGLDDRISAVESAIGAPAVEGDEPVAASGLYAELDKKADSNYVDQTFLKGQVFADTIKNYSTTEQMNTAIGNAVGEAGHLKRLIVTELPTEDIDPNTVYMIKRDDATVTTEGTVQDVYDEYLYIIAEEGIIGTWEKIGNTIVDLSNYYTKDEADEAFISPEELNNELKNQSIYIDIRTKYEDYESDNAQTGSGSISHPDFTDAKIALETYFNAIKNNKSIPSIYFRNGKNLYPASVIDDQKGRRTTYFKTWIPEFSWIEELEDSSRISHVKEPTLFTLKVDLTSDGTSFETDIGQITGSYEAFYINEVLENETSKAPTSAAVHAAIQASKTEIDGEVNNKINYADLNSEEFEIKYNSENPDQIDSIDISIINGSKVQINVGESEIEDLNTVYENINADFDEIFQDGIFANDFDQNEFTITRNQESSEDVVKVEINKISVEKIDGLTEELEKYKTIQDIVNDAFGDDKTYILTSLTQDANGKISYTVDELTPEDIKAVKEDTFNAFVNDEAKANSGIRFINQDEIDKLTKLVLGENGEVGISGTINAANVKELDTAVIDIVTRQQSAGDDGSTVLGLGVERGAQVNKIEGISVDGLVLDISDDKVVNILIANENKAGVVYGATKENFITVHQEDVYEDETLVTKKGTMEVHSLNVNKLVQTPGEWLILNGGNASLNK